MKGLPKIDIDWEKVRRRLGRWERRSRPVLARYGLAIVYFISAPLLLFWLNQAAVEKWAPLSFSSDPFDHAIRAYSGPMDGIHLSMPEYVKGR